MEEQRYIFTVHVTTPTGYQNARTFPTPLTALEYNRLILGEVQSTMGFAMENEKRYHYVYVCTTGTVIDIIGESVEDVE